MKSFSGLFFFGMTGGLKSQKQLFLWSLIAAVVMSVLIFTPAVSALTVDAHRECDDNAVLKCGALTPNEVKRKYYNSASARTIFHNMGITHNDIDALSSTAVEGKVTQGGRVLVNGEEVANGAMTAGRQNISGSQAATANGVTFYKRPPSVSFNSSSIPAFVVMKNGQFDFAILAGCGNPVTATPKAKPRPAPAPTPQPPAATTTPTPPTVQQQTQQQTVVVTKNVPVLNPVPVPTPVPTPAPQPPQPKTIPNTGTEDVVGLGSLMALAGGAGHYIYKRRTQS